MNRRDALNVLAGGVVIATLPLEGLCADQDVTAALRTLFGARPIREGRVSLKLPKLAESGNSVPLVVSIKGGSANKLTVRRACIFAARNPRPLIATVMFGPAAGNATFSTNIRLNGTQDVIAVAEFTDGSLWRTQVRVLVTIGACDALQTRY
jgi:sulfur-oxidizing protein SoxY